MSEPTDNNQTALADAVRLIAEAYRLLDEADDPEPLTDARYAVVDAATSVAKAGNLPMCDIDWCTERELHHTCHMRRTVVVPLLAGRVIVDLTVDPDDRDDHEISLAVEKGDHPGSAPPPWAYFAFLSPAQARKVAGLLVQAAERHEQLVGGDARG